VSQRGPPRRRAAASRAARRRSGEACERGFPLCFCEPTASATRDADGARRRFADAISPVCCSREAKVNLEDAN
jgi:hypothetical protein